MFEFMTVRELYEIVLAAHMSKSIRSNMYLCKVGSVPTVQAERSVLLN